MSVTNAFPKSSSNQIGCASFPNAINGARIWWATGGELHGQSPARLAFLKRVLDSAPREGIEPIDKWQNSRYGGQGGRDYWIYFGSETPRSWPFRLPKSPQADAHQLTDGMRFKAEILDTWNMTTTDVRGEFTLTRVSEYFWSDTNDRPLRIEKDDEMNAP